jgi:hypothetical protein
MRPAPEDHTLAPWRELGEHLACYFAARSRGLLTSEFVLSDRTGKEFGRPAAGARTGGARNWR